MAGVSAGIMGEPFGGIHGWIMMPVVSKERLLVAVEQRWRILGSGVSSVTLQESHSILPLL